MTNETRNKRNNMGGGYSSLPTYNNLHFTHINRNILNIIIMAYQNYPSMTSDLNQQGTEDMKLPILPQK